MAKKKKKSLSLEQRLARRTTESSKQRVLRPYLDRRTSLESREKLARRYGVRDPQLDDETFFQQPLTLGQAQIEADRATNLRYGGVESELRQGQANVAPWFENYRAQLAQGAQQYQQMTQPAVQQAQELQKGTAQTLGLEGQAGEQDKLAAASREALAGLGLTTLQGIIGANQGYFAGQQNVVAPLAERQESARFGRELGDLEREKGDFRSSYLADTRDRERTYGLERSAFGLDVQKAEQDAASEQQAAASKRAESRRERRNARAKTRREQSEKAGEVNKWGYTAEQWARFSPSHRQRIMREQESTGKAKPGALTPEQKRKREKESNKAVSRISTLRDTWDDYAGQTVETPDGKRRPPTPSEIKARLRKEGYSSDEIHIALMIRAGKALTAEDKRKARAMGIYPIPDEWKRGRRKGQRPDTAGNPNTSGTYGG